MAVFNELFASFRDLLSIPSRKDIELLNEKLDRIENLLLDVVSADLFAPVEPVEPVAPVAPVEPVMSVEPVEHVEPVVSVNPVEQVEPVESIKPFPIKEIPVPKTELGTPSDKVLEAIASFKQGATFKKIKLATNFEDKKIRNIIFRLNKLERIKKVKRGVYKAV